MKLSKKTKIFLAGHNGMVGSAILKKLRDNGYKNIIIRNRGQLNLLDQSKTYKFLKKNNPIFLIEIEKKHNKEFEKFFLLMKNLGYKVCIFDNKKKILKNLNFKLLLNKKLRL